MTVSRGMRILLLLRGSAGCGKSTWIEQHGLKPYKEKAYEIASWQDFFDWYYDILEENYDF